MTLRYPPLDPAFVAAVRGGGPDANGQPAERHVADAGSFCRHCLDLIPEGAPMLILAARPFPALQPYAECGPVFLCASDCAAGTEPTLTSPDYLLKGYTADHRIRYGTGRIVPTSQIPAYAAALLSDPALAYVDVRSARNNCFQTRICRADEPT